MQVISKRINKLGRIVLPKDFRKSLGLAAESEVILGIDGNTITVRGADTTCRLCGSAAEISKQLGVCSECIRRIKTSKYSK